MDLNKTFPPQYASRKLLALNDEKINQIYWPLQMQPRKDRLILAENRKDLDRMDISNPKYDRLKLTQTA